jgi:hypothetical protein
MSTKVSGLGAAISVADASGDAQTITNDVTNFAITTPVATQDVTGVDKYAHERIALLRDGTVTLNGVANWAANMSHAVLSTVMSEAGAIPRATVVTPSATSTPNLSMNLLYASYNMTRSNAGDLTWTSEGSVADGTIPTWTNS